MKEENYNKEEWGGWKIVNDMLDHPDNYGIHSTGKFYRELYDFVVAQKEEARQDMRDAIDKMETTTPEDILSGRDTFVGTFVFVDKSKLKTYLK